MIGLALLSSSTAELVAQLDIKKTYGVRVKLSR